MYDAFANMYDALMSDVDYNAWAAYYASLCSRAGVAVRAAVDCACGTGGLTLPLARAGWHITGVDCAEPMLRVAAEKARAAGLRIPFVLQDMRRLAVHRPVDAVICACDGVNYLLRDEDAAQFFTAAHRALRAGGMLCFDISSQDKLSRVLGNHCFGEDRQVLAYLWQNHYTAATRRVQMDLTFFAREADGRYARFTETHTQRAYSPGELEGLLAHAGFEAITFYGEQTYDAPAAHTQRIHCTARKPQNTPT